MKKTKIGVIGGGAAGMTAAITAARAGAVVTLLEGGERVGKKILSTGNGKCNLGNLMLSAKDYYGADKQWIQACLSQFDAKAAQEYFDRLGLMIKEKNGYLYPYAEQAAVVLDVLRMGLAEAGVHVVTDCKVLEVKQQVSHTNCSEGFQVISADKTFSFDKVILACGSKAAPKTGSDGSGYKLAEKLGHRIVPVVPALVQLRCRETYLKEVAGVRAEAVLTILQGDSSAEILEHGELQLTEYGISGIPVFQLSRKVNYILRTHSGNTEKDGKGVEVRIDFLPEFTREKLYERFGEERQHIWAERTAEEFFTGVLNKKLMYLFLKLAGIKRDQKVSEIAEPGVLRVLEFCKDFCVHVTGSNSFDQAQVCAGGVDTVQVGTDMQSKLIPGLFFAGELLDVDGRCGGYNLHWAWCTGHIAGRNASGSGRG